MSKYLFFTDDNDLIVKLKSVLPAKQVQFKSVSEFNSLGNKDKMVIIDGDILPPEVSLSKLKRMNRKKIPVVYMFTDLDGKGVMELLGNGVISVLFKELSPAWIKRELNDILANFHYLERVKELSENENRTKQFLKVVNSLTSDNDINVIMNEIMGAMIDVFNLESAVFFIVKNNCLLYKMDMGRPRYNYNNRGWELNNPDVKWLIEIQQNLSPIFIKKKSRKEYKFFFPYNTILLPLVVKDRFFGLIAATQKPESETFTRNEIALLKAFAEQIAVALENAKLYWDVINTRERLVKKEKEALLNQTILSLNHEINNPLTIISMEAQQLQRRLENNEDNIESRIIRIEKNIDRIKTILEKISALSVENLTLTDYMKGKSMFDLYEK